MVYCPCSFFPRLGEHTGDLLSAAEHTALFGPKKAFLAFLDAYPVFACL